MGNQIVKKPVILKGVFSESDVAALRQKHKIFEEIDIYDRQLAELFHVLHPAEPERGEALERFKKERPAGVTAGTWVYYPWSGTLLHTVGADDLFRLRTNRNQLLITHQEQQKLHQTTVGIAGMSVGAGIALALAYSGISKSIKIADFDELDTSNLNRLRESLAAVGKPKVALAAQHLYELDPFADVQAFEEGIDEANIDSFFSDPKLTVVIDEIDDFKMKVQLRLHAKKHGTPLLMFTSLGDNILIDVERYDSEPELQIFHGLLGDLTDEIIKKSEITKDDERRYAVLLVGQKYIPTQALASLPEMGRSLVGRPQLYSTIAVDGGLAAYIVRQIVLNNKPTSGRYFVKFSDLIGVADTDLTESGQRQDILKKLRG